jgi:Cu(I)/Ag(I) efflux system membrane fusion protein
MHFNPKFVLPAVLVAAAFAAGYWLHQPEIVTSADTAKKPLYYQCPMHPEYKSDRPGKAACCGMEMVPVYQSGAAESDAPGAVRISLEKQQLMGLKTLRVSRVSGSHTVRVLGTVAVDETRVHRVTALAEGVVRKVSPYAAGDIVRKDEPLASYFVSTPELYTAIQSYFVAMNARQQGLSLNPDSRVADASQAQIRLSQELLASYGVSETQLREIERTRQLTRDIDFRAPVNGVVLARNVSLGQKLDRGAELFRVADLSRVWVLAGIFENESSLIRRGQPATVRYEGRAYRASMLDAREFDPDSRTLKARLDVDNPGLVLRPGMFVEVEIGVREPEGISVPVDALIDTGRRRAVFVSTGEGRFEPREVVTGARYGDRVQVVDGLRDGDSVVVSGLFLLDSESRLRLASAAQSSMDMHSHAAPVGQALSLRPASQAGQASHTDPVCGMDLDPSQAEYKSDYQGKTYSFCSTKCKQDFDKNPAKYAGKKSGAMAMDMPSHTDPVCGMDVEPSEAKYKSDYQGKTYSFCSSKCKRDFDKDPARYARSGRR